MKKKISAAAFLFCVLILYSCSGRGKNTPLIIIPEIKNKTDINNLIGIDDIIETKSGRGKANLPEWLLTFNNGGIDAVEKMEKYQERYCFIGRNEGVNFEALKKWEDNYSTDQAFTRLAAARIETRLTSKAALYPDDEYGAFYEKLIKKSFDTEYLDASVEDTYWIKKTGTSEANDFQDIYEFFSFISIEKTIMQNVIRNMIAEVRAAVTPTRAQNNAINNIQKNFFEGF
ncbi:MAG: hypothetical protein LBI04_05415 [Treponema sp.]|jgi:hypothetical protein|nr:hypothetical protein [Treponema sp.]